MPLEVQNPCGLKAGASKPFVRWAKIISLKVLKGPKEKKNLKQINKVVNFIIISLVQNGFYSS